MIVKTLGHDQGNNGPFKIHKRQVTNQTYKRYYIDNRNASLFKICIKRSNQPNTQKAIDGAKKKKTMKVYSYFTAYKKHSQHVSQYVGQKLYYLKSSNKKPT
jgi:hypothetical protein